jgi:hypothetical protein
LSALAVTLDHFEDSRGTQHFMRADGRKQGVAAVLAAKVDNHWIGGQSDGTVSAIASYS